MQRSLIQKYNIPGPRYTSYPTVPFWNSTPSEKEWFNDISIQYKQNQDLGISIYIHLPFCEHLCTYCGCNKSITLNHDREQPYIEAVLKEWAMYLDCFPEKPLVKEIHLGGGTPTFFSSENLSYLINGLRSASRFSSNIELSIEAHPTYTTEEQLSTLFDLGFKRLSIGVQDFDIKVQTAISRIQPFEEVRICTEQARAIGFESINFDLIYGLPFQSKESIQETFDQVLTLQPDRIAYYSYAHVPWTSKAQRLFSEQDLPQGNEKRDLYELGKSLLESHSYHEIGMDHFALASDSLYIAYKNNDLHRNFMGYTTNNTRLMIGLGSSSISDSWGMFIQNEKHWKKYMDSINNGVLPIIKGHVLTNIDLLIRNLILDLMCHFEHEITQETQSFVLESKARLKELINDDLVQVNEDKITIPEKGRGFVRNTCMAFDQRLLKAKPEQKLFSSTI